GFHGRAFRPRAIDHRGRCHLRGGCARVHSIAARLLAISQYRSRGDRMKSLSRAFVLGLVLSALPFVAHAISAPANPQGLPVEQSLQQAADVGRKGDVEKSYAMLKERVAVPEFSRLDQQRQYVWLHLLVVLGLRFNDWEYTHTRSKETTAMPQADK